MCNGRLGKGEGPGDIPYVYGVVSGNGRRMRDRWLGKGKGPGHRASVDRMVGGGCRDVSNRRLRNGESPGDVACVHGMVCGRGGAFTRQCQGAGLVGKALDVQDEGDYLGGVSRRPLIYLRHVRVGYHHLKSCPHR